MPSDLSLRLPPLLKRRIAIAAAAQDSLMSELCRRLLGRPLPVTAANTPADAEWPRLVVPVSEARHEEIRVAAARLRISVNALCVAALEVHAPTALDTCLDVVLQGE